MGRDLVIEEGRFGIKRNGLATCVLYRMPDRGRKEIWMDGRNFWYPDGKCLFSGGETENDIVSMSNSPAVQLLRIQVGRRYMMRCRTSTGPIKEYDGPDSRYWWTDGEHEWMFNGAVSSLQWVHPSDIIAEYS